MNSLNHYQKYMDSLNFYRNLIKENKTIHGDNCSDSCVSTQDDQKPFTIDFYITRSGEILGVELELVWWDPEQHNKKFTLDKFHKCESITLPKGNKHCCYRLYAQRTTDSYVNTWTNFPNSLKLINVDVSKSADRIYYNVGNSKDQDNVCSN
jgi:hypothetical protein